MIDKALDWLDKQRFRISGSLDAADLCDSFEKSARRVPRNICTDPSIEAKRAVSESLKTGLFAIRKRVLHCLNEADDAYIREFGESLELAAAEYLGLKLLFIYASDETCRNIQITITSEKDSSRVQLRAKKPTNRKAFGAEICIHAGKPEIIRAAEQEDLERLLGKIRN